MCSPSPFNVSSGSRGGFWLHQRQRRAGSSDDGVPPPMAEHLGGSPLSARPIAVASDGGGGSVNPCRSLASSSPEQRASPTTKEQQRRISPASGGLAAIARFWVIWLVRNDAIWNGKQWAVQEMKDYVNVLHASWKSITSHASPSQQRGAHTVQWSSLGRGFLKCNVGAAMNESGATFFLWKLWEWWKL
nr:uncharacterized protein LOC109164732 [Ipomoea batatas]